MNFPATIALDIGTGQSPISPRPFAVRPRQMEPESAPLEFLKEPLLSLDPSQKVRQTPKIQLEEVVRIGFTRCGGELVRVSTRLIPK